MTTTMTAFVPTFEQWIATKPSPRKLRLFACGAARSVWDQLTDERSRRAVEVAERFADGLATEAELKLAHRNCREEDDYAPSWHGIDIADLCCRPQKGEMAYEDVAEWLANTPACPRAALLACIAGPCVRRCDNCDGYGRTIGGRHGNDSGECPDCRGSGVVPKPLPTLCGDADCRFCCMASFPGKYTYFGLCKKAGGILHWSDNTVGKLAQAIYDDRDFGSMPILADALEDSGCTNAAILNHCRADGGECPKCKGMGTFLWADDVEMCIFCGGKDNHLEREPGSGSLPSVHGRGCFVIDTILGKS